MTPICDIGKTSNLQDELTLAHEKFTPSLNGWLKTFLAEELRQSLLKVQFSKGKYSLNARWYPKKELESQLSRIKRLICSYAGTASSNPD